MSFYSLFSQGKFVLLEVSLFFRRFFEPKKSNFEIVSHNICLLEETFVGDSADFFQSHFDNLALTLRRENFKC
jgi:hypothetical protein